MRPLQWKRGALTTRLPGSYVDGGFRICGTTQKMSMRCSERTLSKDMVGGVCPRKDTAGFHLQYSKKGRDKEGDF